MLCTSIFCFYLFINIFDTSIIYAKDNRAARICERAQNEIATAFPNANPRSEMDRKFCLGAAAKLVASGMGACYDYAIGQRVSKRDRANLTESLICVILASSAEELKIAYPGPIEVRKGSRGSK